MSGLLARVFFGEISCAHEVSPAGISICYATTKKVLGSVWGREAEGKGAGGKRGETEGL